MADRLKWTARVSERTEAVLRSLRALEEDWTARKDEIMGRERSLATWEAEVKSGIEGARESFRRQHEATGEQIDGLERQLEQAHVDLRAETERAAKAEEGVQALAFYRRTAAEARQQLVEAQAHVGILREKLHASGRRRKAAP